MDAVERSDAIEHATMTRVIEIYTAALRKALAHLPWKPTVVLISQRVSSIRHADQILVLDDGRLAGTGTHDELLQSCPVYQEICRSQYKKEDAQ